MSPAGNVIYVAVSMRCQKNSNRIQSIKVTQEIKISQFNPFLDYGKPEERPECQNSTVEFIVPAEYMSRPPQAAQYLFILDVSYNALKSGYLDIFAEELLSEYKECYFLYNDYVIEFDYEVNSTTHIYDVIDQSIELRNDYIMFT